MLLHGAHGDSQLGGNFPIVVAGRDQVPYLDLPRRRPAGELREPFPLVRINLDAMAGAIQFKTGEAVLQRYPHAVFSSPCCGESGSY